jgi:hypothetical protein
MAVTEKQKFTKSAAIFPAPSVRQAAMPVRGVPAISETTRRGHITLEKQSRPSADVDVKSEDNHPGLPVR